MSLQVAKLLPSQVAKPKFGSVTLFVNANDDALWYKDHTGSIYPFFTGGGGELYESVTYAQLTTKITASELEVSKHYLISDFETIYDQPDYDSGGGAKGTVTTKTGANEPLLVKASSTNTLDLVAWQQSHPLDFIKYDVGFSQTEVMNAPAKGRIVERIDHLGNRTDYDHHNVLFIRYETISGSGIFDSFKDTGFASQEFKTFQWDAEILSDGMPYSSNNKVGNTANLFAMYGLPFILSNNVFGMYSEFNETGNYFKDNTLGEGFSNNIIDSLCFNNIFAQNCVGNTLGVAFSSNIIGDGFVANYIGNSCSSNTIGENFTGNYIENSFYQNTIGDGFSINRFGHAVSFNTIGDGFQKNDIGYFFQSNTIGTNFVNNRIEESFFFNNLGNYFQNNLIGSRFYGNTIGDGFGNGGANSGNIVGDEFHTNTVGANCVNNTFGNSCESNNFGDTAMVGNTIGHECSNNTITLDSGKLFYDNKIGNRFKNNQITGQYTFESNNISNDFQGNILTPPSGRAFYGNNIGYRFMSNNISGDFHNNIFFSEFSQTTCVDFKNNVVHGIKFAVPIDFTSATHVQQTYSCTLVLRSDDTNQLHYLDGTNTVQYSDVNL